MADLQPRAAFRREPARLQPDAVQGSHVSVVYTMGAASALRTVPLPDDDPATGKQYIGIKLRPACRVRFGINEQPPQTDATDSNATMSVSAWGVGGWVQANTTETRLVQAGTGRVLYLRPDEADKTIELEVF